MIVGCIGRNSSEPLLSCSGDIGTAGSGEINCETGKIPDPMKLDDGAGAGAGASVGASVGASAGATVLVRSL